MYNVCVYITYIFVSVHIYIYIYTYLNTSAFVYGADPKVLWIGYLRHSEVYNEKPHRGLGFRV